MALFRRLKTPFVDDLPDGEAARPSGPRYAGDVLRQQREALGLDLDDVAAALRIKPDYLAALEAGHPELLPGPAYAIGFVRAYSDHLRLDGNEILRRFKAESAGLDTKPDLTFPVPLGERSIPGKGMLLVALILMLCGYGTWYYLSTGERSRPERVAEVPIGLLSPPSAERTSEPAAPATAEPAAEAQPAAPPGAGFTAPVATSSGSSPTAEPPAAPSVPPAAQGPASAQPVSTLPPAPPPILVGLVPATQGDGPRAYGIVDGPARIVIRATSDSWIQIRNTDQSLLFTRVLKAGESYRVPDRPGVLMRTGNAGGLEITVDGKPAPSIGPNGAIRNVLLEPQALISGPATGG
ncbi:MAG: helix-turn-helix domain-containing protein [Alphaproteobacteria bacterium]|nr:helix-turn-helix domain-containing protein [Alphaproteobacteria bacterium]